MKIVKYGAEWCGPCHMMHKELLESGLPFEEIDIDDNPDVAELKNISVIPVTEFIASDGTVAKRVEGVIRADEIVRIANTLR